MKLKLREKYAAPEKEIDRQADGQPFSITASRALDGRLRFDIAVHGRVQTYRTNVHPARLFEGAEDMP